MKKNIGFKTKVVVVIFAVMFLGMFMSYYIQQNFMLKMIQDNLKLNMENNLKIISNEIENKKKDLMVKAVIIEKDNAILELFNKNDYNIAQNILLKYIEIYKDVAIEIYDLNGNIITKSLNYSNDMNFNMINNFIKTRKKEKILDSWLVENKNGAYIKSFITIRKNAENIGWVILTYRISDKFLDNIKNRIDMEINIYNNKNRLIGTTMYNKKGVRIKSRKSLNTDREKINFEEKKEELVAVKKNKNLNIKIEVVYRLKEFVKNQQRIRNKIFYLNFLLMLGIVISLNLILGKLIKPVGELIKGLQKIETGNFEYKIEKSSYDELGQAVESFNKMVEKLKENKENEKRIANLDKIASVGRLAASIAHEIKNPLSSISMIANMYYQEFDSIDFTREDFKVISKEINRINDIIERLLDFSRERKIVLKDVDINLLFSELIMLLSKKMMEKGNKLILNSDYKEIYIKADENMLKQAFLNILINSNDSMEKGVVYINIEEKEKNKDKEIKIEIKDNGKGMKPEVLKKAFEPFYTTKTKGSGIGLAVVKKMFDIHRFKCNIDSQSGVGTTITIIIDVEKNKKLTFEGVKYESEILERRD
ncbi:sensor histidine kinase [Haliovirga abyssi]|uniref:histidine kinase n=1 Tax=Haliovirga abyssi TaxID=2996794 RepID=A0AAU9D5B7_9FUSO|nr:HAMP domain-containing sensor histidine kinase [Haliovirga abyssi]BDU49743.1 hypothetical protein HLVA_03120 [Haliovirga abyssi]